MKKVRLITILTLILVTSVMFTPAVTAAPDRTVTFWERGISADYTGIVCLVNGVGTKVIDLGTCYTVISNTGIEFIYQSPLNVDSSKRYVWIYTTSDTTPPVNTQGGTVPVEIEGNVFGYYEAQYKVTFTKTSSDAGSISPSNSEVWAAVGSLPISATPSSDYSFVSWSTSGSITVDNPYSKNAIASVSGAGVIQANFEEVINYYTITPSVTGNGSISPSTPVSVQEGTDQRFIFFPERDFGITKISIDGKDVPLSTYYTFTNVKNDHRINVVFEPTIKIAVTIDSKPTGNGFVTVDGNLTSTPHTYNWIPGSVHTISAVTSKDGDLGVRYNFLSWSDSGAQTHTVTVSNSSSTVTANYVTQYMLTLKTNFGTVSPQNKTWHDAGSKLTVNAQAPSAVEGESYVFGGWKGSFGGYSGGNNPSGIIVMNSPITEETVWQHVFELKIDTPYGTASNAGWYEDRQIVQAAITPTTVIQNGVTANFIGWGGDATGTKYVSDNILMDGPKRAKAIWTTQYQLVFSLSGVEGGLLGVGDDAILVVNGTKLGINDLPYRTGWIANGTKLDYSFIDTVTTFMGMQYKISNAGAVSSPITVGSGASISATYTYSTFVFQWIHGLLLLLVLIIVGLILYFYKNRK
jgi:hypothetical protein